MGQVVTIGLDLAKSVFQAHGAPWSMLASLCRSSSVKVAFIHRTSHGYDPAQGDARESALGSKLAVGGMPRSGRN
jgi:hypothetical protein